MSDKFTLAENLSADSAAVVIHPGGWYQWRVEAAVWAGDVKLQQQMPNGAYADIDGAVKSANGTMAVFLCGGATVKQVRVGAPTGIYSDLISA